MPTPTMEPIHPGEILMLEYLEPLGITQHRVAVAICVPPRRINEIVHGKRGITADTALRLARYFGTSEGVLVLSTGKDLEGLQPGDVIRRIGGKPVTNPREAMEALRAQPADARVAVEYLRDRSTATAQVSVPKALPFSLPRAIAPTLPMPR